MHNFTSRAALVTLCALLLGSAPAFARPPQWGSGWDDGWGSPSPWYDGPSSRLSSRTPQRDNEGEVEVTRFVVEGDAAAALGQGPVKVVVLANDGPPKEAWRSTDSEPYEDAPPAAASGDSSYGPPPAPSASIGDERENATYEAAVIDQLVKAGYDTKPAPEGEGQLVELRLTHGVAQPAEAPHKPVSGEMAVGVSNRGSMMGLGLNIDLTKPKKVLLSTKLEMRIRDQASDEVLWEGRAEIATRDGDGDWTAQAIATRLAEGLFRKFPGNSGETFTLR